MYQEQARRHGQDISTTTDDSTFAGGLRHITSVLPSLMNDIIQHAPESQKVCINCSFKERENVRKKYTLSLFLQEFFLRVPLFSPLYFFFVDGKLSVNL